VTRSSCLHHLAPALTLAVATLALAPASAELIDIFLIGGQANGGGRAHVSGLVPPIDQPQDDVEIYYRKDPQLNANEFTAPEEQWIDLQPGTGADFGAELTLGRNLADVLPDRNFGFIKYALDEGDLARQWNPFFPHFGPGSQWRAFMEIIDEATQAIVDRGDTFRFVGMLWVQGEADAKNSKDANAYADNLAHLIHHVRLNFGEDLPFLIAETYTGHFGETIAAAQIDVVNNTTNTALLPTRDLTVFDDVHYDWLGQRTLGERAADAWLDMPGYGSTPEPASLALVAAGLSLIATRRR